MNEIIKVINLELINSIKVAIRDIFFPHSARLHG